MEMFQFVRAIVPYCPMVPAKSQILFSALDIWSTAARCAVLRSFALLFPSDLTQFTSHSAIREINNILTLHCCIYSLLPAGT